MERDFKSEPRYTAETYYKGFKILITCPLETVPALTVFLDTLAEKGFTGQSGVIYEAHKPETSGNGHKEGEGHICPVHNVEMRKFEKNGHTWFSHKQGESWCSGKAK